MMKLISIAATAASIAATAHGADQESKLPSISQVDDRRLEGMSTEDLQSATQKFIQENADKIRMIKPRNSRKNNNNANGDNVENDETKRKLRSGSSTRRGRRKNNGGKGGKWNGGGGWNSEPYRLDSWSGDHSPDWSPRFDWHGDSYSGDSWSGDSWSGGSWRGKGRKGGGGSGSGKSGKWSGSGDWSSGSGDWGGGGGKWPHKELFHILPVACPNECISSSTNTDYEMIDALKECSDHAENQMWLVRSDGSFVMIESYDEPGKCIAVDFENGDDEKMVAKTCYNGELVLKDCYHADYGAEWYFTGGQLINGFCWGAGLASMMTVFIEDKKNQLIKECKKDVAVWGPIDEAVLKADTFMFVNRLPDAPFFIRDVDDILDGKEPKGNFPA